MDIDNDNDDNEEVIPDLEIDRKAQDAITKLKSKLKACESEKQEYLSGWQRARADFVNLKRDSEERNRRLSQFAQADLIRDLLPVLDSFDSAMANKNSWEKVDPGWRNGVEYIYNQLINVLSDYDVSVYGEKGDKFNHEIHESIESEVTNSKAQHDIITKVLKRGYKTKDLIIRPAVVRVAVYKQ